MSSGINTSLTGLQANQTRADIAANNIANISTPGFEASRTVDTEATPAGTGVTVSISRAGSPLNPEAASEFSNVDAATELVGTLVAQRGFEANVKALQVSDRMQQRAIQLLS
ncbi:flagellar basal-body rod protein FlgC [Verrucomicrobium sp. GAS474]|uniref:flagellar basal body rod protein FlgC n=1 Tax=Verrucomicrobium sp. GAS474 TaxID=1882831 RepID=UPI00087CA557|nr:flagellar basal body rod C-terminal domain-containing protein [Verrucomicrobium sp. GAS474]SDU19779.1 flagellar basal-body rod protein FlgC [Verrucomicrobium sp. GAS474]